MHMHAQHATQAWGEDWQALQKAFEEHRAGWLVRDRSGWLACNKPYPGVVDALASCEAPFYIASRLVVGALRCLGGGGWRPLGFGGSAGAARHRAAHCW